MTTPRFRSGTRVVGGSSPAGAPGGAGAGAGERAGVGGELVAAIVAEAPPEPVGAELRLDGGEGGGRSLWEIPDRRDGLGRPHLLRLCGAEDFPAAIQLEEHPLREV